MQLVAGGNSCFLFWPCSQPKASFPDRLPNKAQNVMQIWCRWRARAQVWMICVQAKRETYLTLVTRDWRRSSQMSICQQREKHERQSVTLAPEGERRAIRAYCLPWKVRNASLRLPCVLCAGEDEFRVREVKCNEAGQRQLLLVHDASLNVEVVSEYRRRHRHARDWQPGHAACCRDKCCNYM